MPQREPTVPVLHNIACAPCLAWSWKRQEKEIKSIASKICRLLAMLVEVLIALNAVSRINCLTVQSNLGGFPVKELIFFFYIFEVIINIPKHEVNISCNKSDMR